MRRLFCPWCRLALPEGDTHCPRCGLRIAALERPRRRHLEAAQAAQAITGTDGTTALSRPLTVRGALLLGALGGVALLGLAAAIAFAVTRGTDFATGLSNAAFFTGGAVATLALALGGVRVSRLLGDVELMKARARGGGLRAAPDHIRLGFATAAAVPLAVAVALAVAAH
jgi:hypothetical protein